MGLVQVGQQPREAMDSRLCSLRLDAASEYDVVPPLILAEAILASLPDGPVVLQISHEPMWLNPVYETARGALAVAAAVLEGRPDRTVKVVMDVVPLGELEASPAFLGQLVKNAAGVYLRSCIVPEGRPNSASALAFKALEADGRKFVVTGHVGLP
eukprot:tig00021339_g20393.t1